MKVRDAIERLRREGWVQVRMTGSHRIFQHPSRRGTVTLPDHATKELAPGTWHNIQEQAGWR